MVQDQTTEQLIERGGSAYTRHAYLEALGILEEVVRREPLFADVHNLIGLCTSLLGRPDDALAAFDRAIKINPVYIEAHLNRAITLNDLGRYDEANESFQRASEADGEDGGGRFPTALMAELARKHEELGDLYTRGDALQAAAEQYRRACEIRPRFADIRNKFARTLLELGDRDAAIEEFRSILDLNPAFAEARANLGLALHRSGDLGAAEAEWERCRSQQPSNAQVESYLGMLFRQREAATGE